MEQRILRVPIVEGPESSDFARIELEQAIDKLKTNKAGDPDEIVPRLITNLPNTAREKYMNSSWNQGYTPTMDRRAIMLRKLKRTGLTSCRGKVMERRVASRITMFS